MPPTAIALIGEFDPSFPPHIATEDAIAHSAGALCLDVRAAWLSTNDLDPATFPGFDGFWIAPGSPYKNLEKTLEAIRFARETQVPCLGTCGGFQHMILEYARNVLGDTAAHEEYEPGASNLFISRLDCSLFGRALQLTFADGSQVARIYEGTTAVEEYYCGFGVNPERVGDLRRGPLRVVGSDGEGEVRVVELPGHPFFIGTLFVPQLRSRQVLPHPLVSAFVQAARVRSLRHVHRGTFARIN